MLQQSLLPQLTVNSKQVLTQLNSGQILKIDSHCRGGLILCKRHHAEFAGPGAAVGGVCDVDCNRVIAIGNVTLIHPESFAERQKAFTIRQKWFRFTQKAMETSVPLQRAYRILVMLEKYFGTEAINSIADDILSQLIGVLPKTVNIARQYKAHQLHSEPSNIHSSQYVTVT
ncbi:hypothetical protein ACE1B6_13920 [Aerosakkonemataceae cyanobacterium BLCC-F154]|uniref:Uncharacterized protein n=1 Tax=Floridaenema fluviatile BLCC-F154 TaxID=3153640 RepID=A0ABV4YER3_9CYAN